MIIYINYYQLRLIQQKFSTQDLSQRGFSKNSILEISRRNNRFWFIKFIKNILIPFSVVNDYYHVHFIRTKSLKTFYFHHMQRA